ncbi:unnamed protein product [Callosobruchus maculatus]|uniref:Uncharacterized protein n=1 Tax=Callosobruchus maculatus TaxID=64391 RepID=A0A653C1T1_CALMS|nr:unnamed protein product [Callosobruchus maculatus]
MNNWSNEEKACVLRSMLKDSGAAILENFCSSDLRDYDKLTTALKLDSASQANFISESCVRRLDLTRKEYSTPVVGINGMSSNVSSGKVSCVIFPYSKPYPSFNLEAIVIPQICEKVPQNPAVVQKWKYLENLCLAEPLAAHDEMEIELLLGVEVQKQFVHTVIVRRQCSLPWSLNRNIKKLTHCQFKTNTGR